MRKSRVFVSMVMVLCGIVGLAANADAQKKRKKISSKPTATIPAALATGDAQIVSQAKDDNLLDPLVLRPDELTTEVPIRTEPDPNTQKVKEISARLRKLEAARTNEYDEKQKRLLLNLDILTRAEQRSESLRKQLFDMIEKENSVRTRLDQIEGDIRPEAVSRSAAFSGSMRPEEIREMRQKSLDSERRNLNALLLEIQNTRSSIGVTLEKSEILVGKLRNKLEIDIDNSFKDDEPDS